MTLSDEQVLALAKPLPDDAITKHPTKTYLSVIHPMAVIDRLNEVFGLGGWSYTVDYIHCVEVAQGTRKAYMSMVKGRLEIDDLVLEQFGGSTNDDAGDALKGGATDALTKIASYLGIGADVYKGKHETKNINNNDNDRF